MKRIIFTLITLLSFSIGCTQSYFGWGKSIKGNGNLKSENRQIDTFDKIEVTGPFEVILEKGKEGYLSITADDNLMNYIVTEVNKNTLEIGIKNKTNLKKYKKLSIVVPVEKASKIALTGSGDIIQKYTAKQDKMLLSLTGSGDLSIPLEVGELKVNLTGSGDISCRGIANDVTISIVGSGDFHGNDLRSKYNEVSIAGSGDAKVYATEKLKAQITADLP